MFVFEFDIVVAWICVSFCSLCLRGASCYLILSSGFWYACQYLLVSFLLCILCSSRPINWNYRTSRTNQRWWRCHPCRCWLGPRRHRTMENKFRGLIPTRALKQTFYEQGRRDGRIRYGSYFLRQPLAIDDWRLEPDTPLSQTLENGRSRFQLREVTLQTSSSRREKQRPMSMNQNVKRWQHYYPPV
jgi:hypothetical protein